MSRGKHSQTNILLESGTNELEVIMFEIGSSLFGINVLKVREIINAVEVTSVPNSHENVEGVIRLRDQVLPVVNLPKALHLSDSPDPSKDMFIISELNQLQIAFRVHHVSRIYRISWEQIEKPSDLSAGEHAYANGIMHLDGKLSILLDFEKVVAEINPKSSVDVDELAVLGQRERSEKRIVLAEDSHVLREMLRDVLVKSGYENLQFFENGKEAWEYLELIASSGSSEKVDLVITDIEMPQMDGHHLTERIKSSSVLKQVPVVIFSSLITADLFHKGEAVGADAQVSKPEIVDLVKKIDGLIESAN